MERENGLNPAIWQRFAGLALLALEFDEAVGGFGGGAAEAMIVAEADLLFVHTHDVNGIPGVYLVEAGASGLVRTGWRDFAIVDQAVRVVTKTRFLEICSNFNTLRTLRRF
ncbi:hypothetical protein FF124_09310 [Martelella lutilitoris]|uniref:Uncharacterized protein n=1 Tax=Martelella lutilitoris TaxID=2583532 RepID=A0A5C4JR79_9HYPH|nr:hypothetical protein [Martelella lutilitoris]TNB47787.1 hypothetical protein FF124_09310 [Martelella lutilitoris]